MMIKRREKKSNQVKGVVKGAKIIGSAAWKDGVLVPNINWDRLLCFYCDIVDGSMKGRYYKFHD